MFKSNSSTINFEEIRMIIYNDLLSTMEDNYEYYKNYKLDVSLEQDFIKREKMTPDTIYVVIKFSQATVNYGQTTLPVTITALSEQNRIEGCLKLFFEFAQKYNLEKNEENTIQQIYQSPVVLSNFNATTYGFRSVVFVSGVFVISKSANQYKFFYYDSEKLEIESITKTENVQTINGKTTLTKEDYDKIGEKFLLRVNEPGVYEITKQGTKWFFNNKEINYEDLSNLYGMLIIARDETINENVKVAVNYKVIEEIPFLKSTFSYDAQADSQAFYNTKDFSNSIIRIGTLTYNIITYLLDNIQIVNENLGMIFRKTSINKKYKIGIEFKNGIKYLDDFVLVNATGDKNIGEIPVVSLTLTN